jgi:transketolase
MRAMREVWGQTLARLADEDDRLLVLDGDLANSTKADIFADAHPSRFLEMGIAEQNMVGVAAGLAAIGFIPWLSTFAVFLTHRAIDPIRMLIAQSHANVKLAGAYSGLLVGAVGKTHLDVQDLAIMRSMPDMLVLAPGDGVECEAMIEWACEHTGPVYLRLSRDPSPDLHAGQAANIEPGMPVVLRDGSDVALVSTGVQTTRTTAAAELLAEAGISARVIHVPWLKPFSSEAFLDVVADVRLLVTTEEHSVIGGLGGLVAETLAESGAGPRLIRLGISDQWGESAPNDFLLEKHGLSDTAIAKAVATKFEMAARLEPM